MSAMTMTWVSVVATTCSSMQAYIVVTFTRLMDRLFDGHVNPSQIECNTLHIQTHQEYPRSARCSTASQATGRVHPAGTLNAMLNDDM